MRITYPWGRLSAARRNAPARPVSTFVFEGITYDPDDRKPLWDVTIATGATYRVDHEAGTITRHGDTVAHPMVGTVAIGEPMAMLIDTGLPGETIRTTAPVIAYTVVPR